MKSLVQFFLLLCVAPVFSQVNESKSWCRLDCEYTKSDLLNAELLYLRLANDSIRNSDKIAKKIPLRFGIVQQDSLESSISEIVLRKSVEDLNKLYAGVQFQFYLEQVDLIISDLKLEDLSENQFNIYNTFSEQNDKMDMITIYILDHRDDFCNRTANSISCGRTGGFSYVLSERSNNVVVSRFDLEDPKIVAHEFGHFFGLYHTFDNAMVHQRDSSEAPYCYNTGDLICDTPIDPGTVYEIYVNYSKCEMIGLKDENGNEYKPMINNIMSYYKPCYLKEYEFTEQQMQVINLASELPFRKKFFR